MGCTRAFQRASITGAPLVAIVLRIQHVIPRAFSSSHWCGISRLSSFRCTPRHFLCGLVVMLRLPTVFSLVSSLMLWSEPHLNILTISLYCMLSAAYECNIMRSSSKCFTSSALVIVWLTLMLSKRDESREAPICLSMSPMSVKKSMGPRLISVVLRWLLWLPLTFDNLQWLPGFCWWGSMGKLSYQ